MFCYPTTEKKKSFLHFASPSRAVGYLNNGNSWCQGTCMRSLPVFVLNDDMVDFSSCPRWILSYGVAGKWPTFAMPFARRETERKGKPNYVPIAMETPSCFVEHGCKQKKKSGR